MYKDRGVLHVSVALLQASSNQLSLNEIGIDHQDSI